MIIKSYSDYPIGLDISDLSIKLIQLKKKGSGIKIQALGKQLLPKGIIENGEIKNPEELIKIITKLVAKPKYGNVSSNEVVACLPETKTFIKTIPLEESPNKISDIIEHEIEKYIPLTPDEIYYDWQTIKKASGETLVLVGAAPKNIVNQYIEVLNQAKLSIQALEIEPISICRALLPEESPKFSEGVSKNYIILDIGAKRASVIVYAQNTIITSISIPISGEKTTEKISKTLEINIDQAEKAKIVCGLDKTRAQGVISEILSEMTDELIARVKETISFYETHYQATGPIDEILLCGGGANIKDLDKTITTAVNIKAAMGNPLLNLIESQENLKKLLEEKHYAKDKNKTITRKQTSIHTYVTTLGLALREIFLKK